jgi:gas vesicle protein
MSDNERALPTPPPRGTEADIFRFVTGFACGVLAGAALAMLVTPASGSETRHWLASQGRAARRRTGQLLHTEQLMAIVRRRGVLGLADVLRRTDTGQELPPLRREPSA